VAEDGKDTGKPGGKDAAPVVAADVPAAPPEKPKRARISHEEWEETRTTLANARALMGKLSNFESQIARLSGTVGNVQKAIQDAAAQAQAQTPYGLSIELTDEDFKDLAVDYPELAKVNRSVLQSIFNRAQIKGTGTATAEPAKTGQPPADPPKAAPTALTREDVAEVLRQEKAKEVSDRFIAAYPNWRELVGAPDTDGGPMKESGAAFHAWLKTQPAAYQQRINSTENPAEMHEALDLFTASRPKTPAAAAPSGQNRRAVIEGAVTPRADSAGPLPARAKSEREMMNEGFASG